MGRFRTHSVRGMVSFALLFKAHACTFKCLAKADYLNHREFVIFNGK